MLTQEELFGKCPYATAQKILSGKWSLIILYHLSLGTKRFNELMREFPDITQTTMTKQLKQLEEYGLVNRKVYAQIPPKVEYSLSPIGSEFFDVLEHLKVWGEKYLQYYKQQQNQKELNLSAGD
jgi:Predicted transcriptional regulators